MSDPELFAALLAEERAIKVSFEQRGMAVIQAAGTFVGIIGGVAALSGGAETDRWPDWAKWLMLTALLAFVLGGLLGLLVNFPIRAGTRDNATYQDLIDDLRQTNAKRARLLWCSLACAILALALMAGSVFAILRPH